MKRMTLAIGIAVAACAGVLATNDPVQREARLLAQVRAEGASVAENLWELAVVREQLRKFGLAADTWGLLRQRHGQDAAFSESSAPSRTWGQIAELWVARLQRKQRLAVEPPVAPTPEVRRAMGLAINHAGHACCGQRDGQVDLLVQSDLDGDRLDELLVVGKYGRLGQRDERFICLLRWAGDHWQVFARWNEGDLAIFPCGFEAADLDGDGWAEVRTLFEPETDNVGIIRCNGGSALWWY